MTWQFPKILFWVVMDQEKLKEELLDKEAENLQREWPKEKCHIIMGSSTLKSNKSFEAQKYQNTLDWCLA